LLLWDDVVVRLARDEDNGHIEIVAHPSRAKSVSFRQAREPYKCRLHLADDRQIDVDLAFPEDWGNIQACFPDECRKWPALGWGNDADGHVEIVRVTDTNGTIPLGEFARDVADFMVHHEA
jgi:hypothetical protein